MLRKAVLIALPVLLAVLTLGTQTAFAAGTWQATVEGTGSIQPGLNPTVFSAQTGTFGGSLIGYSVLVQGTSVNAAVIFLSTCGFTFQTTSANAAIDLNGSAQGACSGGIQIGGSITVDCSATASLTFKRVGSLVVVTGSCTVTVNGHSVSGTLAGVFVWIPTSLSTTVTSFAMAGNASFVTTQ